MGTHTPNVLEIDRKLRDDFRRRIKDFGVVSETTDPLLAVLFRTVAQQIDQVYSDTGKLRQGLLHELMRGLQVQQYLATPAQAAVRLLEPVLTRILNRDAGSLLNEPRLWIKIPMPPGIPSLHHAISGIVLHSMTASNVFPRNQTVTFARDGISIPVTRQGGTPEHLVAPLTVMSTDNDPYEPANAPSASATAGRYQLHNGRLTMEPGRHSSGEEHAAANVRLWLTNGELGNRVGPGDITGFANAASLTGIRIAPLTAASGGSNGEQVASEERRFADALLTRGRIVTKQDLETAALAIDRRILQAESASGTERRLEGLRRVERLNLTLDSNGFTKPEIELPALKSQIEIALGGRLVQGLELAVEFTWQG